MVSQKCLSCPGNMIFNKVTLRCICPEISPYYSKDNVCITCVWPRYWNVNSKSCDDCPVNTHYDLTTKSCIQCPSNLPIWNGTTCLGCATG